MIILLAAVLTTVAFVVLVRVLWSSDRAGRYSTLITLAAVALVAGLAVLAMTGRLHWLAAVGAAALPFLRRGVQLLRYLPWAGPLLRTLRQRAGARAGADQARNGGARQGNGRARTRHGSMSRAEALDILGLGSRPSREEILSAHRRLIQKLHPDRGGSTGLARQLNEARQRLLEDL